MVMQQVAHLHCQHFLRISVCENVLQIETVWRQRACSKWPRPGRIQHQASFWRFQGPAIKSGKEAAGLSAAGLSRAGLSRASWQSWQEATHGKKHEQSRFGDNVHGEATMQWTCQSWFKERRGRRLQWLEQNLCLQGCDRHRCNGDGYCRHTDSPTNPGSNEKHQEARVGGRVFSGVCNPESLPASKYCHSFFGPWSAETGISHGVAGQIVEPIDSRETYWQQWRPGSVQQCCSCSAVFAFGLYCAQRHQAEQLVPPGWLPFVGSQTDWLWCGREARGVLLSLFNFNFEILTFFELFEH